MLLLLQAAPWVVVDYSEEIDSYSPSTYLTGTITDICLSSYIAIVLNLTQPVQGDIFQ